MIEFELDELGYPIAPMQQEIDAYGYAVPEPPPAHNRGYAYFEGGMPVGAPRNLRPNVITPNTKIASNNPSNAKNLEKLQRELITNVWGESIILTEDNFAQTQRAITLEFPDEPRTVDVYIEYSLEGNPTNIEARASFGSRNGRVTKVLEEGVHTLGGNSVYIDIISSEPPPAGEQLLVTVFAKPGKNPWNWTEVI